ncbi:MAG: hypothetical protein IPM20_05200 [Gammaproteobacteria bacterium]|nr:hypothetical protein [Gammaproteobacteria bacterium]
MDESWSVVMDDDERAARERQFWVRYTNTIVRQGIKPSLEHWHVLRAKSFKRKLSTGRLG